MSVAVVSGPLDPRVFDQPSSGSRRKRAMAGIGIGPDAVARAIAFAFAAPDDADIGS